MKETLSVCWRTYLCYISKMGRNQMKNALIQAVRGNMKNPKSNIVNYKLQIISLFTFVVVSSLKTDYEKQIELQCSFSFCAINRM